MTCQYYDKVKSVFPDLTEEMYYECSETRNSRIKNWLSFNLKDNKVDMIQLMKLSIVLGNGNISIHTTNSESGIGIKVGGVKFV